MSKTKTPTLTEAQFAEGEELGFKRAQLQLALDKSIADGITQEQIDQDLEYAFESGRAAKRANDEARAEQAAAERRANRAAFAGMALQGLLAGTNAPNEFGRVVALSVEYADALIEALDNEPVVSE